MKRILLLATIVTLLIACSTAHDKAMTSAQEALDNDDSIEARIQFQVALDEDESSEEAKEMIRLLDAYDALQIEVEEGNWADAEELANDLLKEETLVPAIETQVKAKLVEIDEGIDEHLKAQLKKAEKHVKNEEIKKATKALDKLEKDPFKDRVESDIKNMREQIKTSEKQLAEKKAAEEKEQVAAKLNDKYEQYFAKAKALSQEFAQSIEREDADAWHSLEPAFDDLLNEVYGTIRDNLSEAEFKPLLNEQRAWLDAVIAEDDELAEVGTRAALDSRLYLLSEKKEARIFHLLNTYLK